MSGVLIFLGVYAGAVVLLYLARWFDGVLVEEHRAFVRWLTVDDPTYPRNGALLKPRAASPWDLKTEAEMLAAWGAGCDYDLIEAGVKEIWREEAREVARYHRDKHCRQVAHEAVAEVFYDWDLWRHYIVKDNLENRARRVRAINAAEMHYSMCLGMNPWPGMSFHDLLGYLYDRLCDLRSAAASVDGGPRPSCSSFLVSPSLASVMSALDTYQASEQHFRDGSSSAGTWQGIPIMCDPTIHYGYGAMCDALGEPWGHIMLTDATAPRGPVRAD